MSASFSTIYRVRHAETLWSISGQLTGHADLPLTGQREQAAGRLKEHLEKELEELREEQAE